MAQRGGNIAGVAREQAEKELGGSVMIGASSADIRLQKVSSITQKSGN